jgi:hypothetical protein
MDFGRELYIAWQLAEGRALYVDVASFNGPLSPHVNALWFRLFGLGIRSLVFGNLVILAGLIIILYSVLRGVTDRLAAAVATGIFIVLFAFGEYYDVGNYNYVTPYAHDLVHGLFLSFIAIRCLNWFATSGRLAAAWTVGFFLGLTALTKPEVSVAATIAILLGIALVLCRLAGAHSRFAAVCTAALGVATPLAIAWLLIGRTMPLPAAAAMLLRPYRFLVDRSVASLPFYARMTGLDKPAASITVVVLAALAWLVLFALVGVGSFAARQHRARMEMAALGALAIFLVCIAGRGYIVTQVARPLPLFMCLAIVVFGRVAVGPYHVDEIRTNIARVTLTVFAGLLLGKIALNTRMYQYGFALAMPAFLIVVVALIGWLPGYLERRAADGAFFRSMAAVAIGTVTLLFLAVHKDRLARTTYPLGDGADRILADNRAAPVNSMAHMIREHTAERDRLVVMPEGALLNYLTRRRSSIPYATFLPPELAMFGEERVAQALRDAPPEYIVLVDRPMKEYGFEGFGVDYGRRFAMWIDEHYTPVAAVPGVPKMTHDFGMRLLRRSDIAQNHAER